MSNPSTLKDIVLGCLKDNLNMHTLKIFNIYLYGSQVYGTATKDSDYDFIVVANNSVENIEYSFDYLNMDLNFHIQTPDYFQSRLDWNEIKGFECILFAKEYDILNKKDFKIDIIKPKFRHAVSQQSSNSWVKAQKKIEVENEVHTGQKSLYHSLRMPMYAIQILKEGKITDWTCANQYWDDIKNISDWKTLKDKYKPIHNKIMSEFRLVCPKTK